MKNLYIAAIALLALCSCGGTRSGASGNTYHDVYTYSESLNAYDLEVDPQGITYTIDISTPEGKLKLKGKNLQQAQAQALEEAAMMYNAAKIVNPKFSHIQEGKDILRVTVFGFPARYKTKEKPEPSDVYIIK